MRSQPRWMRNRQQFLPPEIISEILSWLPFKYLIQFQLVCKQWQTFVRNHYFIEKHMSRSPVAWYLCDCIRTGNNLESKPDRTSFRYIHGCDGLILLRDTCSRKYILWNPATCSQLELPDPHSVAYEPAIFFVPATGSYVIVSFYEDTGEEGCEILSPGQNQSWRRLALPQTKHNSKKKERVSIISTGAAVHCVRVMKDDGTVEMEIVSLDTQTECLTVRHFPICELEWNGKLSFVELFERNLELIELEVYKCEKKKVIPLSFRKEGDGMKGNLIPLFAKEGEIWFCLKGERIFTYTHQTDRVIGVRESASFSIKNKLYPYKPSLVTFKGMVPACDSLNRMLGFIKFE